MDLWLASLLKYGGLAPFENVKHMFETIDSTALGGVAWESFTVGYTGEVTENSPSWVHDSYEVWYRNPQTVVREMLANPDFNGEFLYSPVREFVGGDKRRYTDYLTGNWAWREAVRVECILVVSSSNL